MPDKSTRGQRRRVSELRADEVLMLAIDVEVSNGNQLRSFAERFADTSARTATLFAGMASEEDQHRDQLQESYGDKPQTVGTDDVRESIEELELPDDVGVFDDLTLRRAIELVLEAELRVQGFYREAAKNAEDAELRLLFKELGEFETNHVQTVEARLEELADRE